MILSNPGIENASELLLLDILKTMYERTHRLIEQDGFEDFEMLQDLHSEWYWQAEREDILEYLKLFLGADVASQTMTAWHKEFDQEFASARGDNNNAD